MNQIEVHYHQMRKAILEAKNALMHDDVPIGAVIVKNGAIIGRGHNQVEQLQDPTAHAEILAITSACNTLGTDRLDNCTLYVTVEPCVMCTGAIILSKIDMVVFGAFEPKTGACGSVYHIPGEGKLNHKPQVYSGILEEDCKGLLLDFFAAKR